MGLQFRKRTKGKDSWFNFSGSKKNGLGASLSVKLAKNVTYNSRGRLTVNFGNGFRYVSYRKKKRVAKEKTYSPPKTRSVTYRRYEEPRPSREETLSSIQNTLVNVCKTGLIRENADLQIVLDLYSAITLLKEEPKSHENRDLIVVTTNQYKALAIKLNNEHVVDYANTISDYLRSMLPPKRWDPYFAEKIEKQSSEKNKHIWIWATIIFIAIMVKMCA